VAVCPKHTTMENTKMDINSARCNVSKRLKTEIVDSKGEAFWDKLSAGIVHSKVRWLNRL
jgi:hypothetical protein